MESTMIQEIQKHQSPTNIKISISDIKKMFPLLKSASDKTIDANYLQILEVINSRKKCEKCTKDGEEVFECRIPSLQCVAGTIYDTGYMCDKAKKISQLKEIAKLTMAAGISKRFMNRMFETFTVTKDNKKAYETAKDYAEQYPVTDGLLITGTCGTGKTHLAVAILHAILDKNYPGLFITVPDLLAEIRKSYNGDQDSEKIQKVKSAKFLVLDDLGAEKTTDWVQEQLYMIINYRYEYELPTVITSNLDIGQLSQKVGERTTSRLLEMCYGVKLNGEDYRAKVR